MNISKVRDRRFWLKWRDSGALTNSAPKIVVKTVAELGLVYGGTVVDIASAAYANNFKLCTPPTIRRMARQALKSGTPFPEYEVLNHNQKIENFLHYIRTTAFAPSDRCVLICRVILSNPGRKDITIW